MGEYIPTSVSSLTADERSQRLKEALEGARERYAASNPQSQTLYRSNTSHMPGGNTRTVIHALPFPLTIARGKDGNLYDVDGHEYLDFLSEYSAGLFGHSCQPIKQAIVEALDNGWNFGGKNIYEMQLAQIVVDRFANIDLVRFCNSGTEANLMALSAALNYTGRKKVLVFVKGYHGSSLSFPEHNPKYTMNPSFEFVLAPYNDITGTDEILAGLPPDSLAAVMVEPMQGAGGCVPGRQDFLLHLQEVATKQGALLILDEVMTSRLGYGGLQDKLGLKPDLTTLGKWIGGGMSFGAFGGRKDIMDLFDPRQSKLVHSGTFNNNVVTMAAGIAGCNIFDRAAVDALNVLGETLKQRLSKSIDSRLQPSSESRVFITGVGSLMNITFAGSDKDTLQALLWHHMIESGINIATRGYVALNLALKLEHVDEFVAIFDAFFDAYRDYLL